MKKTYRKLAYVLLRPLVREEFYNAEMHKSGWVSSLSLPLFGCIAFRDIDQQLVFYN